MRRRKETVIELTPLLDVILIMLFMIMSVQSQKTEEAEAAAREKTQELTAQMEQLSEEFSDRENQLMDQLDDTESRLSQAEAQLTGYEAFRDYSAVISISMEYLEGGERQLYIAEGDKTDTISFGWDNLRYGENSLTAALEQRMKQTTEEPVFIAFVYDSESIYRRDYDMIASVIDKLQSENDNLYIRYSERNGTDEQE